MEIMLSEQPTLLDHYSWVLMLGSSFIFFFNAVSKENQILSTYVVILFLNMNVSYATSTKIISKWLRNGSYSSLDSCCSWVFGYHLVTYFQY